MVLAFAQPPYLPPYQPYHHHINHHIYPILPTCPVRVGTKIVPTIPGFSHFGFITDNESKLYFFYHISARLQLSLQQKL